MSDIERRLRDLGERVRDEQGSDYPSTSLKGRIRARRFSTAMVASVAIVAAATFAAGWVGSSPVPPAGPSGPYSAEVPAEVWVVTEKGWLGDPGLNLAWGRESETAETLACVGMLPPETSQVDLVNEATGDVLSWGDNFVAGDDSATVCAHNLDPEVLVGIANDPSAHRLVIDGDLEVQLVRTDAIPIVESPEGDCGPSVDFQPTYLPPGWIAELQPGSGGGGAWEVVGHYGSDSEAGTTGKAGGGFAELFAGWSPYPIQGGERIRVLDEPARFGPIHEGFSVEFTQHGCTYALVGYVDGDELKRFAEGLQLPGTSVPAEPSDAESFAAIWPEDIEERAGEECTSVQHVDGHWRLDPIRTAERFATNVLGWQEAQARQSKPDEGGVGVYVGNGPISSESPVVAVYVARLSGCWSVVSVSRLPDGEPTGVSVSVRGREVQIGFDTLDATAGTVEVGYGFRVERKRWVAAEADEGPVTFELDFDPSTTGHFLILFEDQEGNVFSASGGPLPAGDFTAG